MALPDGVVPTARPDFSRPGGLVYECVVRIRGADRPFAATSLEDLERMVDLARREPASFEKNAETFLTDPDKWEGP